MSNTERLTDILEHHGVKGMKWGVRRKSKSGGSVKKEGTFKKELRSRKQELSTLKEKKKVDKYSDDEIKKRIERLRNENDLKRLGGKKHKNDYLDRAKLSDAELKKKVDRLRLEYQLKQQINSANKESKDIANKIIKESAKYAIGAFTGSTGMMLADIAIKESLEYAKSNNVIK